MKATEEEIEALVDFLKVLADRNRLRILGMLTEREHSVKEIAASLNIKEPSASWHLQQLKGLGLVEIRAEGTNRFYRLRQEGIHSLLKDLLQRAEAEVIEDPNNSEFERKTLASFIKKGKLVEIPARRPKLLVVLKFLSERFRVGEFYPEAQVNETLKEFHPDCATLRRDLVDFRFMARKNNVYWRIEPDSTPENALETSP